MHISDVFDNNFKKMKTAVYLLNLFHTGWHKLLLNHSTLKLNVYGKVVAHTVEQLNVVFKFLLFLQHQF